MKCEADRVKPFSSCVAAWLAAGCPTSEGAPSASDLDRLEQELVSQLNFHDGSHLEFHDRLLRNLRALLHRELSLDDMRARIQAQAPRQLCWLITAKVQGVRKPGGYYHLLESPEYRKAKREAMQEMEQVFRAL